MSVRACVRACLLACVRSQLPNLATKFKNVPASMAYRIILQYSRSIRPLTESVLSYSCRTYTRRARTRTHVPKQHLPLWEAKLLRKPDFFFGFLTSKTPNPDYKFDAKSVGSPLLLLPLSATADGSNLI